MNNIRFLKFNNRFFYSKAFVTEAFEEKIIRNPIKSAEKSKKNKILLDGKPLTYYNIVDILAIGRRRCL